MTDYIQAMLDRDSDSGNSDEPMSRVPAVFSGAAAGTRSVMSLLRAVLAVLGAFLIVIGVPIAFVTPFPFVPIGLPIVILGVVLLARNSMIGKRWMQSMLQRHPTLERFAPHWLLNLILGE